MATFEFQNKLVELQSSLLNFAFKLTSDRDRAYDLLQDTTLKALDYESYYKKDTNFKAWVMRIMHNLFINDYRHLSYTTHMTEPTGDIYDINISHDTDETPECSYSVKEINAAINEFSDDFRIPFSLYVSGYKYSEISEKLSLPVGTVKSRIFSARKRLQTRFAGYC